MDTNNMSRHGINVDNSINIKKLIFHLDACDVTMVP